MDNNTQQEIADLKRQVKELLEWKKLKERQQLIFPIDIESMRALNEAMITFQFTRVNTMDVFFGTQTESPKTRGQMRYFDDLTNQNFRCRTSTNPPDSGDFTGTINLTAV